MVTKTRDSVLSYGEDPESLSDLVLGRDRHQDGQKDRIMIASTSLALHAVPRKNVLLAH